MRKKLTLDEIEQSFIDCVGDKFGNKTIIGYLCPMTEQMNKKNWRYIVECDCGEKTVIAREQMDKYKRNQVEKSPCCLVSPKYYVGLEFHNYKVVEVESISPTEKYSNQTLYKVFCKKCNKYSWYSLTFIKWLIKNSKPNHECKKCKEFGESYIIKEEKKLVGKIVGYSKVLSFFKTLKVPGTTYENHLERIYKCVCINCGAIGYKTYDYLRSTTSAKVKKCPCCENKKVNKMFSRNDSLIGLRFKNFSVIDFAGKSGTNRLWTCVCNCGDISERTTGYLVSKIVLDMVPDDKATCRKCPTKFDDYKIGQVLEKNKIVDIDLTNKKFMLECKCGDKRWVTSKHVFSFHDSKFIACRKCNTVTHGESTTDAYKSWNILRKKNSVGSIVIQNCLYDDYEQFKIASRVPDLNGWVLRTKKEALYTLDTIYWEKIKKYKVVQVDLKETVNDIRKLLKNG